MPTVTHPKPDIFRFETQLTAFAAGQAIFTEGEPGHMMYVVKDGEVDIVVHGEVVETVGPGGILGEMALIDKQPRSASAVARSHCNLARITEERFAYLVGESPLFALEVMRVMAHRLRKMDAQP